MSVAKNPPSFVLVDKATGEVVYTKRATGVGSEAINKCVWAGRNKAHKTGRTYFVFLDISGLKVGSKISVPMAYAMGITEEVGPQGSAMPSGRKCCSAPDVQPSGQGMRCMNCQRWEADNYLKNPGRVRKNIFTFNNPKLKFSDLSVGETFVFASQDDPRFLTSGMARGPWIKRSSRTYEHVDDVGKQISERRYGGGHIAVGSASVGVKRMSLGRELPKLCPHCDASYIGTPDMHKFECGPQGGANLYQENPLNRKEVSQIVSRARDISRTAVNMRNMGEPARMRTHIAYGRGTLDTAHTYAPSGARKGVRTMLSRFNRIDPRESSRSNPTMGSYEVFVGNIGQVYNGDDRAKAQHSFDYYVAMSKRTSGRASGEDVALLCEGELSQEYFGSKSRDRGDHRRGVRRNIFTFNNPRGGDEDGWKECATCGFTPEEVVNGFCKTCRAEMKGGARAVRRNIFTFNNPPSGPADPAAARELEVYIENDADLYRQQFIPIVKNLMLKRRKGVYNRELAVKLFMYLMDAGAKKYVAEYVRSSSPGAPMPKIDGTFNKNTRLMAARSFLESFEGEAELGNYDRMIGPVSNPRGANVRKNIFTFNNPKQRPLNEMENAASLVGLTVTTWAPGDGVTRYRFFKAGGSRYADYHQGGALYTALGRKEAIAFIKSYGVGRSRMNPGVCSNPVIRGDKLPHHLKAEVLRSYIYRWTTGNTQRESAWGGISGKPRIPLISDEQWLREHAFHVTKAGKLDLRHHHAEPYYMADDWKKGDPKPNPLTQAESTELIKHARGAAAQAGWFKKHGPEAQGRYYSGIQDEDRRIAHKYGTVQYKGRVRSNPLLQTVLLGNPGSVKTFNEMQDVGKAKYVVNYHDGVKAHRDGSPFFDIAIFSSRDKKDRFVRKLESLGFTRGAFRNPPISVQWDKMTSRQKQEALEISGFDEDLTYLNMRRSWKNMMPQVQRELEASWLDTTSSGGTTRRRRRSSVAVNPLTRTESARILKDARADIGHARVFVPGPTRASYAGRAIGRAQVVEKYSAPKTVKRSTTQGTIAKAVLLAHGSVRSNPGIKYPKPGTKMTVAQAMDLARRIGNRDLIKQCEEAAKLQKVANRGSKCVVWKELPIGSPNKIDMVTAFAHYGDSPETMYRAPKGSKKGPHMYRHKWGEGSGKKKSVPILAAPGGKALITLMGNGQKTGDWMRG